jgi:hypothetical protein
MLLGGCAGKKQMPPSQTSTVTRETTNNDQRYLLTGATSALKTYCSLDEAERYEELYGLISERERKSLEKYQVRNAKQYGDFRKSSEATWSEFVIDKTIIGGHGDVISLGHAKIEENGEIERVSFRARLIKENGVWKVDDWKY